MQNYYEKSAYTIPKRVRLHTWSKIYPNEYGIRLGVILILHQEKQTDMTSEEKQLIKERPVILSGTDAFISYIKEELKQIGFGKILDADADSCSISANAKGIVIEYTADKSSMCAKIAANIAVGRDVKRYPRFYLCRNLE